MKLPLPPPSKRELLKNEMIRFQFDFIYMFTKAFLNCLMSKEILKDAQEV